MVGERKIANRRRAGFTLLELLVVLAIAGLLVALVPPLVSAAVPGTKVKVAARELAITFREARNQAISSSTAVEMQFKFDPPQYRIQGGPDHHLPASVQMMLLEDGTGTAATTVADLARADDETYSLIFYPDGSSTGTAIRLGRDDLHYRISVDWLMGRVALSEPQTSAH